MDLTEAGGALLPRARAVLAAAAAVLEPDAGEPRVRVGTPPSLPPGAMTCVISGLAADGLPVDPVIGPSVRLIEDLKRDQLEVAVVTHPVVLGGMAAGPVVRYPTCALLPASEPAAGPVGLGALRHLSLVLPPRADNPAAHDAAADICATAGVLVSGRSAADERAAVAAVAAGGSMAVTADGSHVGPGVRAAPLADDPLPLRVRAVAPPGDPDGARLIELVTALLREGSA